MTKGNVLGASLTAYGSTAVVLGSPGAPGYDVVVDTLTGAGTKVTSVTSDTEPDICVAVLTGADVLNSQASADNLPRDQIETIAARMAERGAGRMVLVTDADGGTHTGAEPPEVAARASDLAWWKHLAARVASNGVVANQIRVGLAPFLTHELGPVRTGAVLQHLSLRRVARPGDLACTLAQLISTGCAYTVGETVPLDGGMTLNLIPPLREPKPWMPPQETETALPERFDLTGSTALVIGASSGIGAESAVELARRGADVVLMARRAPDLHAVEEQITALGRKSRSVVADMLALEDAESLVESVWGDGIDVFVYAAGTFDLDRTERIGETRTRSMSVNFRAYADISDALVNRWRKAGMAGAIVGVCSVGSEAVPVPYMESYGASKAAMVQYTRCLAATAGRDGIRANCIAPGIIETPMLEWVSPEYRDAWRARTPLNKVGSPSDVASFVAFLACDASSYVTGSLLHVDGGYTLRGLPPLNDRAGDEW